MGYKWEVYQTGVSTMNERIKLLAEQAKDHADYYAMLSSEPEQEIFTEKFAELIVQECISINRQRMFSDYEGDTHRVAHNNALLCATSDMFEHFGVGEQVLEPADTPMRNEYLT